MAFLLPILVALAVVVATVLFFLRKGSTSQNAVEAQPAAVVPGPGRARVRGVGRLRRDQADEVNVGAGGSDDDGDDDDDEDDGEPQKKVGKKKAAKLAQKQQARDAREAMLAKKAEREVETQKAIAEQEAARAAEEEEEAAVRRELEKQEEERKRKEQEEYEAIKGAFVVEEGGSAAELMEAESQSLLTEFVNYIKTKKVVMVEELASHFRLKTKDAIERLTQLEGSGALTGFMDDRGKYIYVSQEELLSAAKWIKQRGRVSLAELSENSNSLVRLSE